MRHSLLYIVFLLSFALQAQIGMPCTQENPTVLPALMYTSQGIGETFGDGGVTTVSVDYTISDIQYMATPPPGRIIITGNSGSGNANDSGSGQGSTQELPAGKDYTITDKDGNVWNVDEKGEISKGGKVAPGGASTAKNTDGITGSSSNAQVTKYTAKGVKIQWQETDNTKYAFDTAEKEPLLKDKYPTLTNAEGNMVYVSYKAVVNKQTDELAARVTFTDESLKDNQIIFKTLNTGSEIEATKASDTDYRLTLKGTMDYAEEDIIAVLMPKDTTQKQQVISSFKLVHLETKTINVALVATDDVSKGKLDNIIEQTNVIWSKAGVTINFIKDEQVFDIMPYLKDSTVISTQKNTLLSTYSSVQQAINKAYGNSDRYVLFVSDKPSSTGQMGYMRLNGQFGYVFGSANDKTAAHELGHGVFNLEHPWEQYKTSEGTTDLLMDYANGSTLTHLDWKQINDPKLKLYVFQKEKDGMAAIVTQNALTQLEQFRNEDGSYTFVSLSGVPITIANLAKEEILSEVMFNTSEDKFTDGNYYNVFGGIAGFKFTNGKEYLGAKIGSTKVFTGYILNNSSGDKAEYYIDELTAKKEYQYVLAGFPGIKDNTIVFNVFPLKSPNYKSFGDSFNPDKISVKEQNKGEGTIQGTFFLVPELDSYMAHPRTEGKDYVEVYAQLNLSDVQKEFIGSLGENIVGSEALYAYAIADLITEGGVSSPCMFDASNLMNLQDQKIGEFLFSQNGISGVDSPNLYYSTNPYTVKLQRTYEILHKWAVLSKRIQSKNITKESINVILSLLDNFDNEEGRICFIRSLNIEIRKAILEKSDQWTVTTNKEALLANLIATTPVADIQTMLEFLKSGDSYKMYWKLYNEINASNTEVYIGAITQLLKNSTSSQDEATTTLLVNKDMHVGSLMFGLSILFAEEDDGLITFYPNGGTISGNKMEKNQPFTPFDFIKVRFLEDFRFTNISSTNQDDPRIKKGEEVLVPALWIYGIVDRQTTFTNFTTVRVIADICAVAASVSTAQPEIFVIVDGAFAAADIAAAVAEDKIMSSGSKDMQQLLDTWNTVGMVWGGTALTRTAGYMVINRVALINYFKSSIKGNISKTQEFFSEFGKLYDDIKAINPSNSFLSHLDNIRLTIQIQGKISYIQKVSVLADEAQYSLQQGGKLVVSFEKSDHYLAKVIVDDGKNLSGVEDIQWYNKAKHGDVSESLSIIDDIEYLPQSSSVKTKGDLEVVAAKNGSVYLRIAEKSSYPVVKLSSKVKSILKKAGYNPEKIVTDNYNITIKYADIVSADRIKEMQDMCRKLFPTPKKGDGLQKYVSFDDFENYYLKNADIDANALIGGFVSKTEYAIIPKNADELIEFNRLDYIGSTFSKDKQYVLIKWENEMDNMDNIVHPFDRNPLPTDEVPYTNTGMLGSQHSLMPEYCIQAPTSKNRINLKSNKNNGKIEALVYNADGSVYEIYKINNKTGKWDKK